MAVPENKLDEEQRKLLSRRICELPLKLQGSQLEALTEQLYRELEKAGISLRPRAYLADEWGCPHGVPVIGIPFYLADPRLCKLEGRLTGIEAENESEIMMYLRHEAGHAFNYAYRLYVKPDWRRLFGNFSLPYREDYRPQPFSARFVRNIPGWYAQKHPDEDFAETFAVWLTPGLAWKDRYAGTPALAKLQYVDRVARRYGRQPPLVSDGTQDRPVRELTITLDTWYKTSMDTGRQALALNNVINEDLRRLFPDAEGSPAADILHTNRGCLIRDVNYWTGMERHILGALFDELTERVRSLGLKSAPEHTDTRVVNAAIFLTTLATNYLRTGQFMEE